MAKRVAILHPDLGIGGAEQLIINIALALQTRGYAVTIYTPFYDPNRCLEESKSCNVVVKGHWFPASIFGRFKALCAYIRMVLCAIYVVLCAGAFDYYILDQVSLPIPLLRCRNRKVLFYCHHPDKLLSTNRASIVMKVYRFFLDNLEEITTGMAHTTLVNSKYTQDIFTESFPLIRHYSPDKVPQILYPVCDVKNFQARPEFTLTLKELLGRDDVVSEGRGYYKKTLIVTSLNRYERKKNINLALESFAKYLQMEGAQQKSLMVIAGGYDDRLIENVEHHLELVKLANQLNIMDKVVFLRSISNDERILLLNQTDILLYTPANEHFGIVPLEGNYLGCVVLACDSGGPLESIENGKTGFLLRPKATLWAEQMLKITNSSSGQESELIEGGEVLDKEQIVKNGRQRVLDHFSETAFGNRLVGVLNSMDTEVTLKTE